MIIILAIRFLLNGLVYIVGHVNISKKRFILLSSTLLDYPKCTFVIFINYRYTVCFFPPERITMLFKKFETPVQSI